MIKIEIECDPHQIDSHLQALGLMRRPFTSDAWGAEVHRPDPVVKKPDEEQSGVKLADLPKADVAPEISESADHLAYIKAKVERAVEGLTQEQPKPEPVKRGRKPVVKPEQPKAQTQAVDPQDAADEADESAKRLLTPHDQIRAAIKRYSGKFGLQASIANMREILGGSMDDVKPDQVEAIIANIDELIRLGKPLIHHAEPVAEGLFESPKTATGDEVKIAAMEYGKKYDRTMVPAEMMFVKEDIPKLLKGLFGDNIDTFVKLKDKPASPEDYGRALAAINDAIANNPFNR